MCSATVPAGYFSGIDQPPNSAKLRPERDVTLVERRLAEVRLAHVPNLAGRDAGAQARILPR